MNKDVFTEFAKTMEGVLAELTNIRIIMEREAMVKKERKRNEVKSVASFDDFLTYYNLSPEVSFDNEPFEKMYEMYVSFCPLGKYEPISSNRFSRSVHKLGYVTRPKKLAGKTVRVFERSNKI